MTAAPPHSPRPLRILIASIGTAGDIHPYVAVALELIRRGHQVVFLTSPAFKDRLLAAGVGFWPVGSADDYHAMVTHPGLVTARSSAKWVFDNLIMANFRPLAEQLAQANQVFRPDLVFAHHIAFGAIAGAQSLRIPLVQGVLAPLFFLSRHEALAMPTLPMPDAPLLVRRVQSRALRLFGRIVVDPPVNKARRALALDPVRNYASVAARGFDPLDRPARPADASRLVPTLALWSPHFRAPQPDDPRAATICGFCAWDRPPASDDARRDVAAALKWMEDDQPPVLVTLGSSVSHHGASLYRACADACAALGRRALLLTGSPSTHTFPPGIRALPYAPYGAVMPRAAAIVHHAGIGTAAAALRAGVPSLIVPFANDEFDNAVRARRLGAAVVLSRRRATARILRTALARLLNDASMRSTAQHLAAAMRDEDGALRTALELERIAAARGVTTPDAPPSPR